MDKLAMRTHAQPPLQWIRAFEASARHLSFTHAAQELNLTQAAISKQIKLLELHLQQPLFVRLTRSLALTKSGEAYLPKVRDALERLDLGTEEVFGRQRQTDVITVRCAISFAVNWLTPRLPDFITRHSDMKVRLISSIWNDDNSEQYDFDIRYGTGNWADGFSHRLTTENLIPLCAPETAELLKAPSDLKTQMLLHVIGYQQGWATWLKAAEVKGIDAGGGIQCDASLVAFGLAAQNCGVALARSSLIGDNLTGGRLVAPFQLNVPVDEAFYLVSPSQVKSSSAHAFAEWILAACRSIS
jgi:LysR family transcriptional regulator, glycine cleavage system transcriptional activator